MPGIGFLNRIHGKSANGIGHCAGGDKLGHEGAFFGKGFGILAAILPLTLRLECRAFCRLEGVVLTPRLYVPNLLTSISASAPIPLDEQSAHHVITVLRCTIGDSVELFDGQGHSLEAKLHSADKRRAAVSPVGNARFYPAPALRLHLVQGLALGDKMDWIIEKAVELGVSRITPWRAQRSLLKLDSERADRRLVHWRSIIRSACEQSGQYWMPQLDGICTLQQALQLPSDCRLFGALDTQDQPAQALHELRLSLPVCCTVFIGPESGLSPEETQTLLAHHATGVSLGPRILRTETAGLACLAALQSLAGDWRNPANQVQ
jgi:16S rRNA (uracil1498-N3)-methyltransferase